MQPTNPNNPEHLVEHEIRPAASPQDKNPSLRRTVSCATFVAMAIVGLVHQLVFDFTAPDSKAPVELIDWITVNPDGGYTLTQISTDHDDLDAEIQRLTALPNTVHADLAGSGTTTITVHHTTDQNFNYCALPTPQNMRDLDYLENPHTE